MGTSSIVCREKNSTAPFSPLILRVDVNEMNLVFFMFVGCVLKCRRSERRKRTVPGRYLLIFLVLICFIGGGQFKRVILASVEVQGPIQREGFSRCFCECWTSRSHDPSFFALTLFLFQSDVMSDFFTCSVFKHQQSSCARRGTFHIGLTSLLRLPMTEWFLAG